MAGDTLPVAEYTHSGGNCSITGGYVYRGPTQTEPRRLSTCSPTAAADGSGRCRTTATGQPPETQRADTTQNITSFGESENGELYAVTPPGNVYRVPRNEGDSGSGRARSALGRHAPPAGRIRSICATAPASSSGAPTIEAMTPFGSMKTWVGSP